MLKKTTILLVLAILVNALFDFFFWVRHALVFGGGPLVVVVLLLVFLLVAIPILIFTVKWAIRYGKGKRRWSLSQIFLLGFFIYLIGAVIALIFGPPELDYVFSIRFRDAYDAVAHARVMLLLALIFLVFSAVYSFFRRITGRELNAPAGYIHFVITLVGLYLLYWPAAYADLAGMPRRYVEYSSWTHTYVAGPIHNLFMPINSFRSRVIIFLAFAQLVFVVNLIYSAIKGKKSAQCQSV